LIILSTSKICVMLLAALRAKHPCTPTPNKSR
jgi:hypothetical protein